MDARAQTNPLCGFPERLTTTATKSKPKKITELEQRLEANSERLAQVATESRVHATRVLSSADGKLSAEGVLVEREKTTLEKERDELRVKLRDARAAWLPELQRAMAPLLTEANQVLYEALALVESAQVVHEAHDKFLSANGHLASSKLRGRSLECYADNIRRFLERK